MFPLDPVFNMFLKFFVVATCVVFWLRLGLRYLSRGYYTSDGPRRRRHHEDET